MNDFLKQAQDYLAERGYKSDNIKKNVYDLFNQLTQANERGNIFERLYKEEILKHAFPKTWAVDFGVPGGDASAIVRRPVETVIGNRPSVARFFEMASDGTAKSAASFQDLVAKLHKAGGLPTGRVVSAEEVIDAALAPYLAGWRPDAMGSAERALREDPLFKRATDELSGKLSQQEAALVAVEEAKNGNFDRLIQLTGCPELAAPMKHIIAARKALANGRVLGGQPLAEMVADAVKSVDSFARITDTLQHYGQLRSASVVQSVKDLCNEYETIWGKLTKERFLPGDRVSDIVSQLLKDIDAQPRDAADAQEIAKILSAGYPTVNHSLPNAVRALVENYQREVEGRKQIAAMFDDEVEAKDREHWSGLTDTVDAIMWAVANVCNQRNQFRAEVQNAGRLESTEEPLFLELVRGRLNKSRRKHPKTDRLIDLLIGTAARIKDVAEFEPIGVVIRECAKVAALAWRVAEEGDKSLNPVRELNGQSKFKKWKGDRMVHSVSFSIPFEFLPPTETTLANGDKLFFDEAKPANDFADLVVDRLVKAGKMTTRFRAESHILRAIDDLLWTEKQNREAAKAVVDLSYILNPDGLLPIPEILNAVRDLQINRSNQADALVAINDIVSADKKLKIQDVVRSVGAFMKQAEQDSKALHNIADTLSAGSPVREAFETIDSVMAEINDLVNQRNEGSFRKTRAELLLLTNTTDNRALIEVVKQWSEFSHLTKTAKKSNIMFGHLTMLSALESIREIVMTTEGNHDSYNTPEAIVEAVKRHFRKMKEGVENWHVLGGLLYDGGTLDKRATLSFNNVKTAIGELIERLKSCKESGKHLAQLLKEEQDNNVDYLLRCEQLIQGFGSGNLEQRIKAVVDSQFKTMGLANQLKDDVEDLASKLSAQVDERGNVEDQRDEALARLGEYHKAFEALEGYGGETVAERLKSLFKLYDGTIELMGSAGYYKAGESPEEFRAALNSLVSWMAFRDEVIKLSGATDADDALAAIRQQAATIADLKDRNKAQKHFIETIQQTVGNNDGTLPSIWSAVRDLFEQHEKALVHIGEVRNLLFGTYPDRPLLDYPSIIATLGDLISVRMHAREAEIVLGEIGPKYVGTLVQKARQAVRVVNAGIRANIEGINRLAVAVAKGQGVDLGDPSSFESIEAAILNLGFDRDRYMNQLREEYIAPKRAFRDGQRVFVHYFDGCSDEYLGQKPAEIRGAKYASATFGWFYMVEFEEDGIGAFNFDYAETRLALVPEAYLLPGDRVRVRDSQTEASIDQTWFNSQGTEFHTLADLVSDKAGEEFPSDLPIGQLVPINQQWSIFDRKGGSRLMVLHAPDKWEAERRAAQRLSKAGKPYVTPALIAIPGVADNAHLGGVTTEVEVKVNRISGRDVNPLYFHRFAGNDVDATNARDAVLLAFTNQSRSGSEVLDKMLPKLRGASVQLTEELEQAARFAEDAAHRAANPSRKFDDGQAVTAKYVDASSVLFEPVIHERKGIVDGAELKERGWVYKLKNDTFFLETDLSPRALFKVGQRVIAKQVNSDGESFAKVLSSEYSDWSKKWSYEVEITAFALKTTRWEEDLKEVPNLSAPLPDALVQQHVGNIVDREEQLPPREFLTSQSVEVWTGRRWEKTTIVRATWTGKGYTYTVSNQSPMYYGAESLRAIGSTKAAPTSLPPTTSEAPIDAPAPKYEVGQEIEAGGGNAAWLLTGRRWSNLRSAWLYDGKTMSGGETSFGNCPEEDIRPRSTAVLSRFLAATADLQAEADKMVGKFVDVATDAKERAIRDGAINPDWLDWASGMTGKRFEVWSTTVAPDGQVSFQIDNTGFRMAAKYTSHV